MNRKSLSRLLLLGASLLFGACSDEPELIIDRKLFDFGEMEVGMPSSEQLFTVRNASPHDVESVSVAVEGAESFVITSNTCEKYLAAGMECEVRVRFAPRMGGAHFARLKVAGAASVGQTELQGTGFAWVEVTYVAPGTRVVAGDDLFTCTQPCRYAVRRAELTLYAAPEGFPKWSAACTNAPHSGCLLRLDGSKYVALELFAPLYKWEVRRIRAPMTVASLPVTGDILVHDNMGVTSLDLTGHERWSLPLNSIAKLVANNTWYFWLLSYNGTVTQYDGDGRMQWAYSAQGSWFAEHLAVDGAGNAYVLLSQGSYDTAQVMKLIALAPDGTERWSTVINEAQFNYPSGVGVDNAGAVYVAGTAYKAGATPQEQVFVKSYIKKFTRAGVPLWAKDGQWGRITVERYSGEFISVTNDYAAPGGFAVSWVDPDGTVRWSAQTAPGAGPGVVDTQGFPSDSNTDPLFGGHETLSGTYGFGRGWFARGGNRVALAPGPITYIDSPSGNGAWVSSLAFASVDLVVGGGFGNDMSMGPGFVRLYDARALTTER